MPPTLVECGFYRNFVLLLISFWWSLPPFWAPFGGLGLSFAPLGPLLAPLGPKSEKLRLGNELGKNSECKSQFIWSVICTFFRKKTVWGCFFRGVFFWVVSLWFFGRPWVPRNNENQAKPLYCCTKIRFSKNQKFLSRSRCLASFWLSFWCLWP